MGFLQVALVYKLDVKYLKSIFSGVSDPSAEKITLVTFIEKADLRIFDLKFLVFVSRSLYVSLKGVKD